MNKISVSRYARLEPELVIYTNTKCKKFLKNAICYPNKNCSRKNIIMYNCGSFVQLFIVISLFLFWIIVQILSQGVMFCVGGVFFCIQPVVSF